MTIQELLDKPEKWFKAYIDNHERDINDKIVAEDNPKVAKWTLWGAYKKCYQHNTLRPEYKKLQAAMPPHKRNISLLTDFNTLSDTTYEDVINLVKDANV